MKLIGLVPVASDEPSCAHSEDEADTVARRMIFRVRIRYLVVGLIDVDDDLGGRRWCWTAGADVDLDVDRLATVHVGIVVEPTMVAIAIFSKRHPAITSGQYVEVATADLAHALAGVARDLPTSLIRIAGDVSTGIAGSARHLTHCLAGVS